MAAKLVFFSRLKTMGEFDEILALAVTAEHLATKFSQEQFAGSLKAHEAAAKRIARASSGSFLGYHALVYYKEFQKVPVGARFSVMSGLSDSYTSETSGEWVEYSFEEVMNLIEGLAGKPSLDEFDSLKKSAAVFFEDAKSDLISEFVKIKEGRGLDEYLISLWDGLKSARLVSEYEYIQAMLPKKTYNTIDEIAASQGLRAPPHVEMLAKISVIGCHAAACEEISKVARRMVKHLNGKGFNRMKTQADGQLGNKVFIGHGRSHDWKDLRHFITGRLQLECDEFNAEPVAGVSNTDRLKEMLDNSAIAFLVMAAEDEMGDGKKQARMNVIHEVGLFQGRLGFKKAIVLLEDGCEEFSNIAGLGQIRFPVGKIDAAFEEIRRVLEREGLISSRP